ncbi:DNA cytosine methyltransferase [Hydrogenimonas urashimensis]|uniref:DNA cytosine methyltransferase n=1 Tax=Hydrogenimonas urashimensis TaxID=2740515 RepID=UPI001914F86A|nr:DNA cytosine methyltransferase [Hydrogenimonas urashimensis]
MKIEAIDLFCGVGGLTHGLKRAGIRVRLGVDVDRACEYAYVKNNEADFLVKSVDEVTGEELLERYGGGSTRLLAGCAPCQTFSTYNQKACPTDRRWWLLSEFGRLVEEVNPELVTMENVPGLKDRDVFDDFVEKLKKNGYRVWCDVVDASVYGLPQRRKRLVLLASRIGEIEMLSPEWLGTTTRTVRDAIAELPPLRHGEADPNDPLHRCSALSPLNEERIRHSKPGGTWRDWPPHLVAECHRKSSGKTYPGVYARMTWDEPAPTMTTQFYGYGNGRFGHPEQDRAISLREGAIFQGFPPDYEFVPPDAPIHMKTIGRMIGNAVPVTLAEAIGASLVEHVRRHTHGKNVA